MKISWRLGLGHVESVNDYIGVLIPLKEAHLYSQSARSKNSSHGAQEESEMDEMEEVKDGDSESQGMLRADNAEYTIEGLRKEMREGRKGKWTTYESMCFCFNKSLSVTMDPYTRICGA